MSRDDIEKRVRTIIEDMIDPSIEVKDESFLVDDLEFDDLGGIELIIELEEEFEVEIPDEEFEVAQKCLEETHAGTIKTFKQVVDFVEKKLS